MKQVSVFLALVVAVVIAFLTVWALNFASVTILSTERAEDFRMNFSPEIIGFALNVIADFLLFNWITNRRTAKALKEQAEIDENVRFAELSLDMGGESNQFALRAVRLLRFHPSRYLTSGALEWKVFSGANLEGAYLQAAKLKGVHFWHANLMKADLSGASLEDADLEGSKLEGANLFVANLKGSKLYGASFDTSTVLPDGKFWTPETDLKKFTDLDHPEFFIPWETKEWMIIQSEKFTII